MVSHFWGMENKANVFIQARLQAFETISVSYWTYDLSNNFFLKIDRTVKFFLIFLFLLLIRKQAHFCLTPFVYFVIVFSRKCYHANPWDDCV